MSSCGGVASAAPVGLKMDRNGRMLSLGVAAFAMAIVGYLAWNPRGLPRSRNSSSPNADSAQVAYPSFDPGRVIDSVDPAVADSVVRVGPNRIRNHLARLHEASLEVAREEIGRVVGDTVYDAVAALRPYWLEDDLQAAVRVGGQLLGEVDTLDDIPLASVDVMRLEFSATEPHWVIQIFMK